MVQIFRSIEMGNLTIDRCFRFLNGEWQTDAFPCSRGILCIIQWLAYIPGMVGYREFKRHAEVVVVAGITLAVLAIRSAFYKMELLGSLGFA